MIANEVKHDASKLGHNNLGGSRLSIPDIKSVSDKSKTSNYKSGQRIFNPIDSSDGRLEVMEDYDVGDGAMYTGQMKSAFDPRTS